MREDAVVLAVRKKRAVILGPDGIFQEIRNEQYVPGQRIAWKKENTGSCIRAAHRTLLIAACMIMLFISSALAVTKYVPWTVVSVSDGEASIRYQLNARNEILSADADDGISQDILESVNYDSYEPVEAVLTRTLTEMNSTDDAETPRDVTVEMSTRFGSTSSVERAVSRAGSEANVPVTIEKREWHGAGHRPPENVPLQEALPVQSQDEEPGEIMTELPEAQQDSRHPMPEYEEPSPEFNEPPASEPDSDHSDAFSGFAPQAVIPPESGSDEQPASEPGKGEDPLPGLNPADHPQDPPPLENGITFQEDQPIISERNMQEGQPVVPPNASEQGGVPDPSTAVAPIEKTGSPDPVDPPQKPDDQSIEPQIPGSQYTPPQDSSINPPDKNPPSVPGNYGPSHP